MTPSPPQEQPPTAAQLLDFEETGPDRFRARFNLDNLAGAVFGGQALGQSLAAARRTAPDWPAQNLSGLFLRSGKLDEPIEFAVERVNDSRSFAARRVLARQSDGPIFTALCSFHRPEPGVEHQFVELGEVPVPETLVNLSQWAAENPGRAPASTARVLARPFPIEMRLFKPEEMFRRPSPPLREFWFRVPTAEGLDAFGHEAILALMSDYWIPSVIANPHVMTGLQKVVSLNHAMWFHAPAQTSEWLLMRMRSDWAAHARGLTRAEIFDRQGRLVASATQEALIRSL